MVAVRVGAGRDQDRANRSADPRLEGETRGLRSGQIATGGETLKVRSGAEIALEKTGSNWRVARGKVAGLRKTHGLQGPADDAFPDPFLLVRPTGTPWNEAVNQQALRTLARFDRLWAKYFRGHPYIKDDTDVTSEDIAKYHLVLFGDPGSNQWFTRIRWAPALRGVEHGSDDYRPRGRRRLHRHLLCALHSIRFVTAADARKSPGLRIASRPGPRRRSCALASRSSRAPTGSAFLPVVPGE
jgi:hypothetical protein